MISITSSVTAQGEHGRRAAAELQVVLGDVRKLTVLSASENTTPQTKGLVQRINGGFSALDILLRLSDQEAGRPARGYGTDLATARNLLSQEKITDLEITLTMLQEQFPLEIPEISVTEKDISEALDLHKALCMACHDNPAENVERPAYNLYKQSVTESEIEFFARMLVGVRGDRITGIDNPFSDIQLVALIELYRRGQP